MRFGFDPAQQAAIDIPFWNDPTPAPATSIGLFGGQYMPGGVNKLFDFGFNDSGYSDKASTLMELYYVLNI